MIDMYVYDKESDATTFLAGATGALTEMLEGLIGWEPFEQGNYIETDLFYLGEADKVSIEEAMKERFRGNWYMCTELSEDAQKRIIDSFSLDLKTIETPFENIVTDIIRSLMKQSYRDRISDYQKYIHEYCQEIEECFLCKIKRIYSSTKNSNYRLMEENYGFMLWDAVFVEFDDGHVLMLLPSNSE